MKFDDRLATAMRISASGPAMARVELRQLIDLLGTSPAHLSSPGVEAAYARIASLAQQIPLTDRAAIVADRGLRLRSARTVAMLATSEPEVAQAAVLQADLTADEWVDLIPVLPAGALRALHQRDDIAPSVLQRLNDRGIHGPGLPSGRTSSGPPANQAAAADTRADQTVEADPAGALQEATPGKAEPPPAELPQQPAETSISALVRRIEAYRRARQAEVTSLASLETEAPRLPLGDSAAAIKALAEQAIDFATDPAGTICWADSQLAPMLVGYALLAEGPGVSVHSQRRPILGHVIVLSGAPVLSGAWQVDAVPRFATVGGRFQGYHGRLRRIAAASAQPAARGDSEGDRIRQILHELRTPVNAIQGFAEVIQQQLFGGVPHEYRALAATIAGDAARILAALEELERLARLETGAMQLEAGETDLAAAIRAVADQLRARIEQRKVAFAVPDDLAPATARMSDADAQLLAWRLLATLGGAAMPGETLKLVSEPGRGADHAISIDLPASLRGKTEQEILSAAVGSVPQALAAGMFGVGFALRLARAELRAAGGELTLDSQTLKLRLPDLTQSQPAHSESARG